MCICDKNSILYQEKDDRGDNNGVETAQVGISDEGTEYREKGWDANPSVDILSCSGQWLVEFICEVRDEVTSEAIVGKALSHFNNFSHKKKKKKKKKKKERKKKKSDIKGWALFISQTYTHTFCTEIMTKSTISVQNEEEKKKKKKKKKEKGLQMTNMAAFQPPLEDFCLVETSLVSFWPSLIITGATELSMEEGWYEKFDIANEWFGTFRNMGPFIYTEEALCVHRVLAIA